MDQEIYPAGKPKEQDRIPEGKPTPIPGNAVTEDRLPGLAPSGPSRFGRLKSQKWLVFALMGLAGGATGAILAAVTPRIGNDKPWQLILEQGIWTALAAGILTGSLFLANETYARRQLRPKIFCRGLLAGLIGGFISGAVAQLLFGLGLGASEFTERLLQVFCWGIMGALLGIFLSKAMPNFGPIKGCAGGFAGGFVGGGCFLAAGTLLQYLLPNTGTDLANRLSALFAQIIGMGILGAALGLIMVIVESLFREASLEVVWGPNESTYHNLGAEPIHIGGGKNDQIYVRGLGERHSHVVLTGGAIEYVDAESQKRTALKNGSTLQIGPLNLVVHAAA